MITVACMYANEQATPIFLGSRDFPTEAKALAWVNEELDKWIKDHQKFNPDMELAFPEDGKFSDLTQCLIANVTTGDDFFIVGLTNASFLEVHNWKF